MNQRAKTWAWRLAKLLLAAAILVGVGRQFYHDLGQPAEPDQPDLSEIELRPAWLAASGGLYLLALSLSAYFWYRLLGIFGPRPPFRKAYRAYFLGQLGKYAPGKAWALLLRGGLVSGPEVRMGVAIITAFYEVLTTMAAGALVAAVVFVFDPPRIEDIAWHPAFTGLLLLGLCGLPLLPGIFNFLTQRMAARFASLSPATEGGAGSPRIQLKTLAAGLALTGCGWGLLGLSVWTLLQGVLPAPPELTFRTWAYYCGSIGLAYVAGFLAFMIPSGVGVREYFLRQLLGFGGPANFIAAAVIVLRLTWMTSELVLAGVVWFIRAPANPQTIVATRRLS
jgi:hypothetical protein